MGHRPGRFVRAKNAASSHKCAHEEQRGCFSGVRLAAKGSTLACDWHIANVFSYEADAVSALSPSLSPALSLSLSLSLPLSLSLSCARSEAGGDPLSCRSSLKAQLEASRTIPVSCAGVMPCMAVEDCRKGGEFGVRQASGCVRVRVIRSMAQRNPPRTEDGEVAVPFGDPALPPNPVPNNHSHCTLGLKSGQLRESVLGAVSRRGG